MTRSCYPQSAGTRRWKSRSRRELGNRFAIPTFPPPQQSQDSLTSPYRTARTAPLAASRSNTSTSPGGNDVPFQFQVTLSTLTRPRADGKHVGLRKGCGLGQSVLSCKLRLLTAFFSMHSALVNASRGFGITPPNARRHCGLPAACPDKRTPVFGVAGIQKEWQ
jgi:hypothetical protein